MVRGGTILFIFNIILALYFANIGLNLVNLEFLDPIKNWIILVGGFLMVIDGILVWNRSSRRYNR